MADDSIHPSADLDWYDCLGVSARNVNAPWIEPDDPNFLANAIDYSKAIDKPLWITSLGSVADPTNVPTTLARREAWMEKLQQMLKGTVSYESATSKFIGSDDIEAVLFASEKDAADHPFLVVPVYVGHPRLRDTCLLRGHRTEPVHARAHLAGWVLRGPG